MAIRHMTHGERVRSALLPTKPDMDHRVQSVLAFMMQTLQADDLLGVAEAVAVVAPSVWGNHRYERVNPLLLVGDVTGAIESPR